MKNLRYDILEAGYLDAVFGLLSAALLLVAGLQTDMSFLAYFITALGLGCFWFGLIGHIIVIIH